MISRPPGKSVSSRRFVSICSRSASVEPICADASAQWHVPGPTRHKLHYVQCSIGRLLARYFDIISSRSRTWLTKLWAPVGLHHSTNSLDGCNELPLDQIPIDLVTETGLSWGRHPPTGHVDVFD